MNRVIIVSLVGLFASIGSVFAEPANAESLEWVIAKSDRIVVGNVTAVGFADEAKKCETITVAVSKTLKGEHSDSVQFVVREFLSGISEDWLARKTPMIICLVKNDGKLVPLPADKFAWVIRDDHNHACAILLGKKVPPFTAECIPAVTRDYEFLDPKNAVEFVEKTVKAQGRVEFKQHTLIVPFGTPVAQELAPLNATFLDVPVDATLEKLGRSLCGIELGRAKVEGAKILTHFKNEENVRTLKSLLADENSAEQIEFNSTTTIRITIYYVRQAAFDALRSMDVDPGRPVLEIPLETKSNK